MRLTMLSVRGNGQMITLYVRLPVEDNGKVIADMKIINRALRALGIGANEGFSVS